VVNMFPSLPPGAMSLIRAILVRSATSAIIMKDIILHSKAKILNLEAIQ
jgi:hypothetical protein